MESSSDSARAPGASENSIAQPPRWLTRDALWKVAAYRHAYEALAESRADVAVLLTRKEMVSVAGQLNRAVASIGANLAEGYSRTSKLDRARFYEYALGSARESRHWYCAASPPLSSLCLEHRAARLTEIIRLLLTMIPSQRGKRLRSTQPLLPPRFD